jgi:hypothetical protein
MDHSALYAQVDDEIRNGKFDRALFAQAFAEADGDEARARARYIRLRVNALKGDRQREDRERAKKSAKRGLRAAKSGARWLWTLVLGLGLVALSLYFLYLGLTSPEVNMFFSLFTSGAVLWLGIMLLRSLR